MKKISTILLSMSMLIFISFSSCKKKKEDDPAPAVAVTPVTPVTPTVEKAPKLKAGAVTTFTVDVGRNGSWVLTNDVEDPQGDTWVVSSVTSSESKILLAGTGDKNKQAAFYEGVANGTAIISVVLTDSTGASRTVTATVTVQGKDVAGPVVDGPKK